MTATDFLLPSPTACKFVRRIDDLAASGEEPSTEGPNASASSFSEMTATDFLLKGSPSEGFSCDILMIDFLVSFTDCRLSSMLSPSTLSLKRATDFLRSPGPLPCGFMIDFLLSTPAPSSTGAFVTSSGSEDSEDSSCSSSSFSFSSSCCLKKAIDFRRLCLFSEWSSEASSTASVFSAAGEAGAPNPDPFSACAVIAEIIVEAFLHLPKAKYGTAAAGAAPFTSGRCASSCSGSFDFLGVVPSPPTSSSRASTSSAVAAALLSSASVCPLARVDPMPSTTGVVPVLPASTDPGKNRGNAEAAGDVWLCLSGVLDESSCGCGNGKLSDFLC
mmetsp:Transcript_68554/g.121095  ORF Transcript_68554/g.121095 Transcript_68554/m.121095 type:complete len:331 (-) Transcript_68554:643-1635(-)